MPRLPLLLGTIAIGLVYNTSTLVASKQTNAVAPAIHNINIPTKIPTKMRILLTNDDGCNAFGLLHLKKQLEEKNFDVWLVAPSLNQSAIGTAITFKPNQVIQFVQHDAQTFCFLGTPSDSIDFALLGLLKDSPPDLIISGVNNGPNTGIAQLNSGTVAAALRAIRYGYPAIAASIGVIPEEVNHYFPSTKKFLPDAVDYIAHIVSLLNTEWMLAKHPNTSVLPKGTGLSINYPALSQDKIKGVKYVANEFNPSPQITYTVISNNEAIQRLNPIILKSSNESTDTGYLDQGYITYTVIDGDWNAKTAEESYQKILPAVYPY